MIKIQPSGDYVQLIYVDPVQESVQQELRSDTDAFEVSYDSDGKLFMQFGAMRFENPDPTDFEVDGSPVTDAADFITKLNALFTGGGGGGITIYTGDGNLSGDRTINLNGKIFSFSQIAALLPFFSIDPVTFLSRLVALDQSDLEDLAASSITLTADKIGENGVKISISSLSNGGATEIIIDGILKTVSIAADNGIFFNDFFHLNILPPPDPQDGDIWREDNTDTGLKYRVGGVTKTIVVS